MGTTARNPPGVLLLFKLYWRLKARLKQVNALDDEQLDALDVLTRASSYDRWDAAWDATQDALTASGLWELAVRVGVSGRNPGWDATQDAIVSELVAGLVEPAHVQVLRAPLDFVLDPPRWWSELGSRNLFLEMLANGSSVADAVETVTRLR